MARVFSRSAQSIVLAIAMLTPFTSAHSDEDYSFLHVEVLLANKYVSEGFLERDSLVNGYAIEFEIPVFPMFIGYSTLRDYDGFHEDGVELGFQYTLVDNTMAIGATYEFGTNTSVNDLGMVESEFGETTELFLSFTSAEFYYTRLAAYYTFSFETEGGILGLGLDVSYDINDLLNIGGGLLAEFDRGYVGIEGLSGFFHMDYYLSFGVGLFGGSALTLTALYTVPFRDSERFGATEEVVYQLSLVFAI